MGSGHSVLDEVEFGEALPPNSNIHKIWTQISPARFQNIQNVTVFQKNFNDNETEETKKFYENGIKNLKLLRHPSIMKFYTALQSNYDSYLIVERVRPLDFCLNDGEIYFEIEEILCGLQNIFDAVKFLHENAKISHNNIGPSSVFVCPDQTWKLGSFEFSLNEEGNSHWCQSDFVKFVKEIQFVPPEDQKVMEVKAPSHARDVFGLGKLVEHVLPLFAEKISNDQLEEINELIRNLCESNACRRPTLVSFDYGSVFRNSLSDITSKLRNIPLMNQFEKEEFLNNLLPHLRTLSPALVARKLTKSLLSRYVLIENLAVSNCLDTFLTPKNADDDEGLLPIGLFKQFVVPELKKIFCVHEKFVRLNLLSVFDRYVDVLDKKTLQDLILPELLLGMKDVDESIVASSMNCLARLVPILGPQIVTGFAHKKYFSDGRPRASIESQTILASDDVAQRNSFKSALELDSQRHLNLSNETKSEKIRKTAEERRKEIEEKRKSKKNLISAKKIESKIFVQEENQSLDEVFSLEGHPAVTVVTTDLEEIRSADVDTRRSSSDWTDWEEDDRLEKPENMQITSDRRGIEEEKLFFPSPTRLSISAGVNEKPLGAEFDVLAVEICPVELETDDFFVDMAPVVRKPLTSEVKIPSRFEVLGLNEQDSTAGWSDQEIDS